MNDKYNISDSMVNNKEFLQYIKDNERTNTHNFLSSVRVNKKSITVKVEDKNYLFNELFREIHLYNMIIRHLSKFTETDRQILEYRYPFKSFKVN